MLGYHHHDDDAWLVAEKEEGTNDGANLAPESAVAESLFDEETCMVGNTGNAECCRWQCSEARLRRVVESSVVDKVGPARGGR